MKIYLEKAAWGELTLILTLACFAFLPTALAVTPAGDGGYPNQNAAEDEDTLFSLTPGADNTAMRFDALDSNTTGSDNALASWTWTLTRRLNTGRYVHTATLLQNGMVLVAGGADDVTYSRAPNSTTRQAGLGLTQEVSPPHELFTRRRCYKTAWSSLQGD